MGTKGACEAQRLAASVDSGQFLRYCCMGMTRCLRTLIRSSPSLWGMSPMEAKWVSAFLPNAVHEAQRYRVASMRLLDFWYQ